MKASELRLGNWVSHNGNLFQVYAETFCDIESTHLNPDPIPLTEEWLIKLGFYKTKENAGNLDCYKIKITTHSTKLLTIAKWIESPIGCWQVWIEFADITRIAYVHHLQNLYFALTGEELTIKETV